MRIDPWQVPVFVMAGIILVELTIGTLLRSWGDGPAKTRARTVALGLLATLVLMILVMALGPSLADQLASVAAAVAGMVALWLTWRSYQATVTAGTPDPPRDAVPDQPTEDPHPTADAGGDGQPPGSA
ncbi:hypothetical protein [Micromonospora echinofusca]|uniref:Low temperature requirement A protein (LtrA) n=1 Tax=Micromonospora echinofusca TaxID=47858 RepID=A0ABS3VPN6_MICEH|nr:hypothetical protein [Micromonospora echinofusca]MBO4206521.1 hypothetical protein [Micromonospora echinofusca]